MLDVMLDLETMGNGPDAAIVAIGAVEFDLVQKTTGERFYAVIDLHTAVEAGGVMDASTVLWWMRQGDSARAAFSSGGEPIQKVLAHFATWLQGRGARKDVRIWGNGAAFDNVILANAYRRAGPSGAGPLCVPWMYWNDRCYRTVKALHKDVPLQRTGTHHNAVDDAQSQAEHLIAMLDNTRALTALDKELT